MAIKYTSMLDLNINPHTPEIDHPEDFGFTLFKEQRQVIYLMNELEKQPSIILSPSRHVPTEKICYNKLRLGACLSFGKTLVTLALIKLGNEPIKRNWYSIYDRSSNSLSHLNSIAAKVVRKYYINTTLIIVSQSVYHQWKQHATTTKVKFLGIETNVDFRSLCILFLNNKEALEEYDVILMIYKHLPHESLPKGASDHLCNYERRTTINVLGLLSLNTEWKRVVIDDFDTINITQDITIPTRMTWCISTTSHQITTRHKISPKLTDLLSVNHKIMDIVKDPNLSDLTIRADLDISTKILPQVKVTAYTFLKLYLVNKIVNDMEYSDEVIERINSGDISGAASVLGITVQCNTAGEFLSCILEKNKTTYYESISTCSRFERLVRLLQENNVFVDDYRLRTCMVDFYDRVASGTEEQFEQILNSLVVNRDDLRHLEMLHGRAKSNVTRSTHILDRLKRNIEGGECQKCLLEPEGSRYIVKCCDILLCEDCMTLSNHSFISRCPNCISFIEKNSVVEVPEKISLEQFLEYDINNAMDDIEKFHKEETDAKVSDEPEIPFDPDKDLEPKTKALIKIIKGEEPDTKEITTKMGLNQDGIPESETYIEKDPERISKYLVFVSYAKCANELHDQLKVRGIESVVLRGANKSIIKTIDIFKNSTTVNVMFMYSTAYCAGLNLEFATHMIFHHSILDKSINKQLIGRAQRLGRKESLKLIYLRHKGEKYL